MATLKVGINGFGRIGRLVVRAGINNPQIEFVGINDLVSADNLAYLFKYDSTHGTYPVLSKPKKAAFLLTGVLFPVLRLEILRNCLGAN